MTAAARSSRPIHRFTIWLQRRHISPATFCSLISTSPALSVCIQCHLPVCLEHSYSFGRLRKQPLMFSFSSLGVESWVFEWMAAWVGAPAMMNFFLDPWFFFTVKCSLRSVVHIRFVIKGGWYLFSGLWVVRNILTHLINILHCTRSAGLLPVWGWSIVSTYNSFIPIEGDWPL